MLVYHVLNKEKIYHIVANDLRSFGVKYRFKKSMLKSERPEICKDISKKIFKTPLFYQSLDIVNLTSGGIVHVPAFVIQASTFLEKYITQEGLFRKAGSQARQKELMSRLDNGGSLGEKNHAIDVANCLKSFFRDLPEPLIPYIYHDLFIHCALLKNCRVQALLLACILLPPYHLNTLAFFMEFLKKVSMYEKQNKMSIENLAKIIAPNIMPLQDISISAMQNRLQMHLTIIKILIENSQNIGILPPHIAQTISTEINGSTDNGLDSFEQLGRSKKKKHRSGSLTRMFNGLKKIVGKSTDDMLYLQTSTYSGQSNIPPNKFAKKRKVLERSDASNIKKKRVTDKIDKSKKIRLSLDKLVPKNKAKNLDSDSSDLYMSNYKTCTELKWWSSQEYDNVFVNADVNLSNDSGQDSLINKDHHRTSEPWLLNASTNSRKLDATDESDNTCLLIPEEKSDSEEFDTSLPNADVISSSSDHCEEDYVKIRKSEYEDIKNRVSAIESRISQEFGCIYNDENNINTQSINKVQTAYEKTLEEARIENNLTNDYLAKKLSKELKIRRSGENKIIRSPSARKIGSLRRRSQEKITSKRIRRTASWHITPEFNSHHVPFDKQVNIYPAEKESTFSSKYLEKQFYRTTKCNEIISDNTKDEIAFLRDQVNTLIFHSTEQQKVLSNSDLNISGFENLQLTNNYTNSSVRRVSSFHGKDFVDNSSYFDKKIDELKKSNSHQNIILNNIYLQKDNISVSDGVSDNLNKISWKDADGYFKSRTNTPAPQTGRASVAKLRTQNAGMVLAKAKLFDECTTKTSEFVSTKMANRKHNRDNRDNANNRSSSIAKEIDANNECFKQSYKRSQISRKQSYKDAKNKGHAMLSPNTSPQIKTQITTSLEPLQDRIDKNHCSVQKLESQNQKLSNKDSIIRQISIKDNKAINITRDIEVYQKENKIKKILPLVKMSTDATPQGANVCFYKSESVSRTPHIKRPLTVKTPKGSKSLVRKPPFDTRRTPLKATAQLGTPKRQSPRGILKKKTLSNMHM